VCAMMRAILLLCLIITLVLSDCNLKEAMKNFVCLKPESDACKQMNADGVDLQAQFTKIESELVANKVDLDQLCSSLQRPSMREAYDKAKDTKASEFSSAAAPSLPKRSVEMLTGDKCTPNRFLDLEPPYPDCTYLELNILLNVAIVAEIADEISNSVCESLPTDALSVLGKVACEVVHIVLTLVAKSAQRAFDQCELKGGENSDATAEAILENLKVMLCNHEAYLAEWRDTEVQKQLILGPSGATGYMYLVIVLVDQTVKKSLDAHVAKGLFNCASLGLPAIPGARSTYNSVDLSKLVKGGFNQELLWRFGSPCARYEEAHALALIGQIKEAYELFARLYSDMTTHHS